MQGRGNLAWGPAGAWEQAPGTTPAGPRPGLGPLPSNSGSARSRMHPQVQGLTCGCALAHC